MTRIFEDEKLRNRKRVFRDRADAGKMLARHLAGIPADSWVLAIPAGGVPVALEIARTLNLAMDLMIVRKIQIPGETEMGFGAVGPDGETIFNEILLGRLGLAEEEIRVQAEKTRKVVAARERLFREDRPFPNMKGKPVILVDDGLASGFTMIEAVRFMKRKGASRITVAVPTAPEDTVLKILPLVDEVYCLNVRTHYPFAVADAYQNWYDLPDAEVVRLVEDSR